MTNWNDPQRMKAWDAAGKRMRDEEIGINGLTRAETDATASVMGLCSSNSPVRDPQAGLTLNREPQPLTDEQIDAIFFEHHSVRENPWVNWRRFARAVLAAAGPVAQPLNTSDASGSPLRQGAEPDGQDLNPVSVKDLSASASPATKEQQ